jgi:hypothetical protein
VKQARGQASWIAVRVGVSTALGLACSAEHFVISVPLESGADAGLAPDPAAAPLCPADARAGIPLEWSPPALAPGQAGRWRARIFGAEASKFPSGQLELALDPARAELRFAAGTPLPVLINDGRGYLCRAPSASTCTSASGFVSAFAYTLADVAARGSILSFRVFLEQPWNEWCQLQAPISQEIPGCDPFYDVEAAYSEVSWGESCAVLRAEHWFEIDCERLATVERHACVCSDVGCRAAARTLEVNVRLVSADALDGALWFAADRAQVLHFERQPEPSAL